MRVWPLSFQNGTKQHLFLPLTTLERQQYPWLVCTVLSMGWPLCLSVTLRVRTSETSSGNCPSLVSLQIFWNKTGSFHKEPFHSKDQSFGLYLLVCHIVWRIRSLDALQSRHGPFGKTTFPEDLFLLPIMILRKKL